MAVDPRHLKPSELCRLLNSTPLGEVINDRQLYRHRQKAGFRIGDGNRVDLFRYIAWLLEVHTQPRPEPDADPYDTLKENARARNMALSLAGRDIGDLPAVVKPRRKARATRNFRFFCEAYFPITFHLAWSADHLKVIAKIEEAVLHGGLFAMAMPRGSGKTTLAECACLWAILYGHRNFVALLGSDERHAGDMLQSVKTELDGNELLLEDFPEVAFPIQCLGGLGNRCKGQLFKGERTHIGWTAREVILPTIPESPASGAIINVCGITGRIRGLKYKRADGETVRPSLVILDDPQTDESASSPAQCAKREQILAGAILGLAGPGKKISGIMPCTVIRKGDMADNILDREKHPEWNGERTKLVYAFPTDEKLWAEYAEIRANSLRAGHRGSEATKFYRKNRKAMDAGAIVAWKARFNPDELSAVQHAMNLKLQNEAAFFAEYQNEPLGEVADETKPVLSTIAEHFSRLPRGVVPLWASKLTCFWDVQGKALFYAVVALADNFTGAVIDYGVEPEQPHVYYSLRDIKSTLQTTLAAAGKLGGQEAAIWHGLDRLTARLLARPWKREDGTESRIDRCLIDSGWGDSTETIYEWCRRSPFAAIVMPSKGVGVTAGRIPMTEYVIKPTEYRGLHFVVTSDPAKRVVRLMKYDTNFYKTFLANRIATLGPGALTVYGDRADAHRVFTDNFAAEFCIKTEGRGRTVWEWRQIPGQDNHLLDCVVGCLVAGALLGCRIGESAPPPRARKRRRVSYF